MPTEPRRTQKTWGKAWEHRRAFDFIRGREDVPGFSPLFTETIKSNPETRDIRNFFTLKDKRFNPYVYRYVLHYTQKVERGKSIQFHPLAGVAPNIALYHNLVASQFFWRYYLFFLLMTDRAFSFSPLQVVDRDHQRSYRKVDKSYTGKLI